MVHVGACLARTETGETVLVDGAIPGELVDAEIAGRRGGVTRARTLVALEPSPDRVSPPCPYVPECGGCDMQHVAYDRQLELKREVLRDCLRRQHVEMPGELPVRGMTDPWRYRWRGEFHVVPGRSGIADAGLGFNRARSWRPIAVDDCLIHHPAITSALPELRDAVRRGATDQLAVLRLTVGAAGGELLVRPRPARALDPVALEAAALATAGGARWVIDATTLRWRGWSFRVGGDTFVQVNQSQMETLYGAALESLGTVTGERVVDAYAGVGVLSVALGDAVGEAGEVICIEANRSAALLGVLNARLNGVEARLRYLAQPVEAALGGVLTAAPVGAVLLDPPRAGCAGTVTALLALAGPARLVYLSCDPATLARDLRILATLGPYEVTRLELVDMFPQTHHIECVAALQRVA